MYRVPRVAGVALAIGLAGCALVQLVPSDGSYDGELCVSTGNGAPNCGAAEVSLSKGIARVQVSDMVYHLMLLESGRMDLILMHGAVHVDDFSATYTWEDSFLRFVDADRRVRYRIRFANPAP